MNTLVIAITSYAGMGPYVANIVNAFTPYDGVSFFLVENENHYYKKNIRKELHPLTIFFTKPENKIKTTLNVFFSTKPPYYKALFDTCDRKKIDQVYFIAGCIDPILIHELQKRNIKCVLAVHDLHPHESKKNFILQWRHKVFYKKTFYVMDQCDSYITNDYSQFLELKTRYPNKEVNYHEFPSLVTKDIEEGGLVPDEIKDIDKPFILFFGRIEEYKGIRILYELFINEPSFYKHYKLVIAGSGKIPFERRLSEESSSVLFINRYIDDKEVKSLYTKATCVVYPYISATQSGVLSLAFFFQCPTITSDVPFFKHIIENSGGGLSFKNGDKESLKDAMMTILKSDNTRMKENQTNYYSMNCEGGTIKSIIMNIFNYKQ